MKVDLIKTNKDQWRIDRKLIKDWRQWQLKIERDSKWSKIIDNWSRMIYNWLKMIKIYDKTLIQYKLGLTISNWHDKVDDDQRLQFENDIDKTQLKCEGFGSE